MIYTTSLGSTLEKLIAIAKDAKVPLLLDDAAGIPPLDNLKLYAKMGVDLYCFSGGKGLCGPQCSGLLLGRKDLIEAAMLNTSPWEGAVCRAMKVGKEEVMGCLAAVEAWTEAGPERPEPPVERTRRTHSEVGGYRYRRQDGDPHSRGRQPLPDSARELG